MKYKSLNEVLIEWNEGNSNQVNDILDINDISKELNAVNDFYKLLKEVFNISKKEFLEDIKDIKNNYKNIPDFNANKIIQEWKKFIGELLVASGSKRSKIGTAKKAFNKFINLLQDFYLEIMYKSGLKPLLWVDNKSMECTDSFDIWCNIFPKHETQWDSLFKWILLYSKSFGIAKGFPSPTSVNMSAYILDVTKIVNLYNRIAMYHQK